MVCSWSSWAIPGVEASARRIAACSWGEAASPTSRLYISIPSTTATTASSAPMARVANSDPRVNNTTATRNAAK
jgi:hypothetical protein